MLCESAARVGLKLDEMREQMLPRPIDASGRWRTLPRLSFSRRRIGRGGRRPSGRADRRRRPAACGPALQLGSRGPRQGLVRRDLCRPTNCRRCAQRQTGSARDGTRRQLNRGTPKEGWDHSTPWLRRVIEDVWGADLLVVQREFTLVGVNPALEQFTEMAAEIRTAAEELAAHHGRSLARDGRRARLRDAGS